MDWRRAEELFGLSVWKGCSCDCGGCSMTGAKQATLMARHLQSEDSGPAILSGQPESNRVEVAAALRGGVSQGTLFY